MCAYLILMCLNWIEYECLFIKKRSIYSVSPVIDMNIDESQNIPSNDRFFLLLRRKHGSNFKIEFVRVWFNNDVPDLHDNVFILITAEYLPIYCRLSAKSMMHDTGK